MRSAPACLLFNVTVTLAKKMRKIPLCHPQQFKKMVYCMGSVKTDDSVEDISLYQRRVIAEIIHGFCHDQIASPLNFGYLQYIVGKLSDQCQIIF